ncbi:hypothetical protein [Ruegeria meonggei]|uniref:hypothetical protein n=1 Tax=Ruegeria meonggei TaxID=1446476 RepID=UPI00366E10FF
MSIRNRLAALESQQVTKSVAKSGATSELMKQLHAVAERIRGTPLCDLTSGASPVTIAALILDGRVDDEVAPRCVELSKQTTPSAKLFQCFLDAAGCKHVNLTEEG